MLYSQSKENQYELNVLVKGRPINEYPHNGQLFVEGRDGSNFEIEFKNLSPLRVEAVLAVDGLSVIDGSEAGPTSSGYVVEPYGKVRIPGWKLSDEQVAAFVFSGKKKSYAAQTGSGSTRNTGVLGAMVFAEKRKAYVNAHHQYGQLLGATPFNGMPFTAAPSPTVWTYNCVSGTTADAVATSYAASLNNINIGAAVPTATATASAPAASPSQRLTRGSRVKSLNEGRAKMAAPLRESMAPPVEQTLGTGFGSAQDFGTTAIEFNRGDLTAMMVIYYDDSRGLRARGIELVRPSRQRVAQASAPMAFPGMSKSCVPPRRWQG